MAGALVIGAEEIILVRDKASYAASRPIQEGIEFVRRLQGFPTTSLTVIVNMVKTQAAQQFCKLNRLGEVDLIGIIPADEKIPEDEAQWHAIQKRMAMGPIWMVITPHALVYKRCQENYQQVLLYGRCGGLNEDYQELVSWEELQKRNLREIEAEVDFDEQESKRQTGLL